MTKENPRGGITGHPKGLYPLFFTEMWERLAFYLMLGILVLYASDTERGGLGLSTKLSTEIFGSYLAFVYFTPFLGGLIADRFLGYRLSVLIGGLCMAGGLFTLSIWGTTTLCIGLVLLCVGNGLFKPNISAMVGNLYEPGDPRRDAGFNIFYMGINIGAALSALLSAPLRNKFSFNAAFFGAGVGLCIGVLVLLINWAKLARADRRPEIDERDASFGQIMLTILLPAAVFGLGGWYVGDMIPLVKSTLGAITFGFLTGMIPVVIYFFTLIVRAGPEERPGIAALMPVYVAGGAFFMVLHLSGGLMTIFTEHNSSRRADWVPSVVQEYYTQKAMPSYFGNADAALPRPDKDTLITTTSEYEAMFGAKRITRGTVSTIVEQYPDVKALDSTADGKEYADKWGFLVCKVFEDSQIKVDKEKDAHGVESISVKVEPETATPMRNVIFVRNAGGEAFPVILVTKETFENVYKKASDARFEKGEFANLFNAELITSFLNPLFVVALTPIVVAFFSWRVKLGKTVSTARKILYGMLITVVAVLIVAAAAYAGKDGSDKVSLMWLVAYYAVVTVGELCLSPMGLSLVTKLSPKRLVGLMMGGWFLATAIGNKLSGFLSGLAPTAAMFLYLSVALFAIAMVILALQPMLNRAIKKYGA
ncbi:MAG: peptide MFS transporter [Phycisphaerales bacterium]|nr:peptide MFS transporter [Phycisphaerales bacterium]MCB9863548.1 peptide MFS transporter [Phycisphaerales bacterium]